MADRDEVEVLPERNEYADLRELHEALLEKRRQLAATVADARQYNRNEGHFTPGDGAQFAADFVTVQEQIEVVASVMRGFHNF